VEIILMSLAKFSVKQPVLVNLVTFFLILAGWMSLSRLPREMFPNIPTGKITITAIYPGVSPSEMESLVGIKIEREIKDISGIKKIITNSAEGVVIITVETDEGVSEGEVSKISLDIQSAVGRISDLPVDMDKPVVKEAKMEVPIVWLGLNSKLSAIETRILAKELRDKIEKIKNVSTVSLMGMQDLEIKVEVDPEKMTSYNLSLSRIIGAIRMRKQDIPGGTVKLEKGEYLIRVMGKVTKVSEIRDIIVSAGTGGIVRIGDVATVREGLKESNLIARVKGNRSIYLVVNKKHKGDAIDISDEVKTLLKGWHAVNPEEIKSDILFDSSVYIKRRQNTLYSNGLLGLVLVVLVLFLFLSFKTALITALGIPVAFFGTFVVMYYIGLSFNMISMFGLIMALGMIVDDAIVVVENIYRYIIEGLTPSDAAIKGAQEVFWPVIGSVSTTVLAFSTLTFMPGTMGKVISIIPIVVAIALSISLIEALFVLPSHMAEWVKIKKVKKGDNRSTEKKWFLVFREGFAKTLGFVTRFWPVAIVVFVGAFIGVISYAKANMEFVPFPSSMVRQITIDMETAPGSKLEYTEKTVRILEKELNKALPSEVESHFCMVGTVMRGHSAMQGTNLAQCTVNFANEGDTSPRNPLQMLKEWRAKLSQITAIESSSVKVKRGGPPAGAPIEIQVRGADYKKCLDLADKVKSYGMKMTGVTDMVDDSSKGKRELRIIVDQEQAAIYGFDPATVGLMVRNIFAGGVATTIQRGDDDIDVVVRYPDNRRRSISELENLQIISPVTHKRVSLRAIASIKEGRGAGRLVRVDEIRAVTIIGEIDVRKTNVTKAAKELKIYTTMLAEKNPGYTFKQGGEVEASSDMVSSLIFAAILSMLGIYIILATIFQSFLQPFIVLMAIPFGAIGVIVGLNFHGMPLSMIGMMGVVGLLGVVVNDSLVMVDFINSAVKKGHPVKEAVVLGGKLRLRPVILTTLTTIFGLLPMAIGVFGSEEFLAPMAISMVWGLGFSTLLTLFLVPCVYLLIDWIRRMVRKPFDWKKARSMEKENV
jgi:multidrug efflux pump subunit AcrB